MKYCPETTKTHNIAIKYESCIEEINSLIEKEGYKGSLPLFSNSESILNMDLAEILVSESIGRKEKNKSMDMAFGISDPDNSSKKQMLMVELKFNMTDFYGLKKQDLEGKVAGSTAILADSPPLYKQYIFIFKENHIHEAISRMYRMVPKIESNYMALDMESLKERFFY
jgi:hypothetical protein